MESKTEKRATNDWGSFPSFRATVRLIYASVPIISADWIEIPRNNVHWISFRQHIRHGKKYMLTMSLRPYFCLCVKIIKCFWCPIRKAYRSKLFRYPCILYMFRVLLFRIVGNSGVGRFQRPKYILLCCSISGALLFHGILCSMDFIMLCKWMFLSIKICSPKLHRALYIRLETPDTVHLFGLLSFCWYFRLEVRKSVLKFEHKCV